MNPEDLYKFYAKNKDGNMVPYSNFLTMDRIFLSLIHISIRALGVYREIYPHDITAAELKALPDVKGVICLLYTSVGGTTRPYLG